MASLMLSRHGIWYYRKVNVLPSGKRREIRRSLRTRSKSEAKKRIAKYQENLTLLMMDTSKQVLTLLESLQTLQDIPNGYELVKKLVNRAKVIRNEYLRF